MSTEQPLSKRSRFVILRCALSHCQREAWPKEKNRSIDPATLTGEDLHKIRLEMNLTVKEFAEAIGVTPASIYRWEQIEGILKLRKHSFKAILAILEKEWQCELVSLTPYYQTVKVAHKVRLT